MVVLGLPVSTVIPSPGDGVLTLPASSVSVYVTVTVPSDIAFAIVAVSVPVPVHVCVPLMTVVYRKSDDTSTSRAFNVKAWCVVVCDVV